MEKQKVMIHHIPAILWGNNTGKLFIAVHGNMSHKEDDAIAVFAQRAINHGYQVLSFDLPEHGERKNEQTPCKVQNCVEELKMVMDYCKNRTSNISLYAVSIGAYFSLLSYKNEDLQNCLFLSPVVDMERIIKNMMAWFQIDEARLKEEKEIPTPIGQTLYWDYYSYVKSNPTQKWDTKTAILYGEKDNLCEFDIVDSFCRKFGCELTVKEGAEHYFHTKEQLDFLSNWVAENLE